MNNVHAGGRRKGAGRPLGRKNNATVAREASQRAAALALLSGLPEDVISNITPLEVMLLAMRAEFAQGNFAIAASIAEKAAGYCHSKKAAETVPTALPADLMPDPPSISDEPGPANPVY